MQRAKKKKAGEATTLHSDADGDAANAGTLTPLYLHSDHQPSPPCEHT